MEVDGGWGCITRMTEKNLGRNEPGEFFPLQRRTEGENSEGATATSNDDREGATSEENRTST